MNELIKRLIAWRDKVEPLDHEGFCYGMVEIDTINKVIDMLNEEHELIDEGEDFLTGTGDVPVLTHRWRCPVCNGTGIRAKPEQLVGYNYCHMCGAKLKSKMKEEVKDDDQLS